MDDATQTVKRSPALPVVVLCLTSVPVVLAILAIPTTIYSLTVESEGWGSMFFRLLVAPAAAAYTFLFCVIPSFVLWRSRRSCRASRISLYLSLSVLTAILLAWLAFEPLRQHFIFGR